MTEYIKHKIYDIPLDQLSLDADQPRKYFDESELDILKKSIKQNDLIYPVIFRIDENDNKILVFGERRFMAFLALAKETIPAMLIDYEKNDEITLIDNNFKVLGNKRESVVSKLQELLTETQNKLGITVS